MVKLGIVSDTHADEANALPHVIDELIRAHNVEAIIHCGDIEPKHLDPALFKNLKVVCALNDEQLEKPPFKTPPAGWEFTVPGDRVRDVFHCRMYIGHKRSYDLLKEPETAFRRTIDLLRKTYDGLRWVCSGHTHHQLYFQTQLVNFVNPGAIDYSMDGYEYAVIDTDSDQIIFGRIPKTRPIDKPFSVGVISDSLNISRLDPTFWKKLRKEFEDRNVRHVIHCSNLAVNDIGVEELSGLHIHYCLRKGQSFSGGSPQNWHLIFREEPVVTINGYQFFIHFELARTLLEESEVEMDKECLKVLETYPEVSFILYGGSNDGFLMGGQRARIINPGDAVLNRNFAVIHLPVTQITFGHVPIDPLPELPK